MVHCLPLACLCNLSALEPQPSTPLRNCSGPEASGSYVSAYAPRSCTYHTLNWQPAVPLHAGRQTRHAAILQTRRPSSISNNPTTTAGPSSFRCCSQCGEQGKLFCLFASDEHTRDLQHASSYPYNKLILGIQSGGLMRSDGVVMTLPRRQCAHAHENSQPPTAPQTADPGETRSTSTSCLRSYPRTLADRGHYILVMS